MSSERIFRCDTSDMTNTINEINQTDTTCIATHDTDSVSFVKPQTIPQIDHLLKNVPNMFYLLERAWFMKNKELQKKLILLVNHGLGHMVNVMEDNFENHIDSLIFCNDELSKL
jgi:hypothetical protein